MVKERYFDKVAKKYDFYTKILMLGTYDKVREEILSLGSAQDERALDLCCGTGYLTGEIKAREVVGLDLSQQMLSLNKKKNNGRASLLRGDAFKLPFCDESFDAVYFSLSTHEFRNLAPILSETHRILKRRGKLVIFDIFKPSFPLSRFFVMVLVKYLAELGRMWVYTDEEWRQMLRDAGFADTDIKILYKTGILIRAGK